MTKPKCITLVGYSGAGKDYIAAKYFPEFVNYKINQPFKDVFERDHGLNPGDCNNKALRSEVLKSGPLAGLTIQSAMVLSFEQSMGSDPTAYGYKFKILPIKLPNADVVITDLRKPTEAIKVLAQDKYEHKIIWVENSHVNYEYSSDERLLKITQLYIDCGYSLEVIHNNFKPLGQ